MAKNIVICSDGTGNEVEENLSNVLKLYRVLDKGKRNGQIVFYDPGLGTLDNKKPWSGLGKAIKNGFFGLTGANLDSTVIKAYKFLIDTYEDGDNIYLFGYSRGAYVVKVLAALIHLVGLLKTEQKHLCHYAFGAYRQSSEKNDYRVGERFRRVIGTRRVPIKFLGLWDTVSAVMVPVSYGFEMQNLIYTDKNPGVEVFRQALAIDEMRRMFRVHPWKDGQQYKPNPYKMVPYVSQDSQQVWFAGAHGDIGGGFPEKESGLAKITLGWMIEEAENAGLKFNTAMKNHLVFGKPRKGSRHKYLPPDPSAKLHRMASINQLLEHLPRRIKFREWKERKEYFGFYFPKSEPRIIPDGALIHQTVFDRLETVSEYKPVNIPVPAKYEICS